MQGVCPHHRARDRLVLQRFPGTCPEVEKRHLQHGDPCQGGRSIQPGKGKPFEGLQARPTRKINIAFTVVPKALPVFWAGLFLSPAGLFFFLIFFS
jgi:hypothetical protein